MVSGDLIYYVAYVSGVGSDNWIYWCISNLMESLFLVVLQRGLRFPSIPIHAFG